MKAASDISVAVGNPSQDSSGSKLRLTNEPMAKQPRTLRPSIAIQQLLPKGKGKAKANPETKLKVAAESSTDDVQICSEYMQSTVNSYT